MSAPLFKITPIPADRVEIALNHLTGQWGILPRGYEIEVIPDHRELLEKYIAHVGYHEGVDFLHNGDKSPILNDEEWAELQKLAETSNRFGG